MTERTISKVLAAQEDLALGQGTVAQTRQGSTVTVNQIDLFWVSTSIAELQALDTAKYKHAVLDLTGRVLVYRFDGASAATVDSYNYIAPAAGAGRWVLVDNSSAKQQFPNIADLIAASVDASLNFVEVSSYYDWIVGSLVPSGGHIRYRTGGTNAAPTAGTAVSVSSIGGGDGSGSTTGQSAQAGLCWDADGIEWRVAEYTEYDVKMFGAKGDNSTDDTVAISDAQTYSGTGGYLVLSEGTYVIDTDLTINEETTLVFRGGNIKPAVGNKVIIYGSVVAGDYDQIFTITDYETNIRWLNGQDLLATWYGAVGDNDAANAAANHLAMQVAVYSFQNKNAASVEQESRPYGVVRIPRGRYVLNGSVWQSNTTSSGSSIDPNAYGENIRGVSIKGDGFASTRIAYSDTTNTSIQGMFRLAGTLAAKVSDIYFSSNVDFGTYPNSAENKVAIRFDKGGNEVFFERIRIQQFERGFRLNSMKDCFLTDCTIDGCVRYAMEVENNGSVHLTNCDLFRNDLGTDFLTTNSYPDTDKHGVIGLIDDSAVANFIMLVNCHLGLGGTNANILYSEGAADGVYMQNCRAVDDDGSGEFNIKAKNTNFYVDNCDFTDFGLNLIRCGGHFSNTTLGKSKVWDPGVKDTTGVDILKLHNVTFRESSTIAEAWLQVNVGNDYESNAGTKGKIELHGSNNIIKTTNNFCTIQEVEYASVKNNYLWNVDGSAGIFIDSDVTNAQMIVQGNIVGDLAVPTNGISVQGDNTHLCIITGNEVSNSSSTGVSVSGTNSGSWITADNLDTTVI